MSIGLSESPRWGTIATAAALKSVSADTIRREIARGNIYAERVSARRIRVDLNTVRSFPVTPASGDGS